MTNSASPIDIVLLRYVVAGILLAPVWFRPTFIGSAKDFRLCILLACCQGAPLAWLVVLGIDASSAYASSLAPALVPVMIVAGITAIGRVPTVPAVAGAVMIFLALVLLSVSYRSRVDLQVVWDNAFFVFAAMLGAVYFILSSLSKMSSLRLVASVNAFSIPIVLFLYFVVKGFAQFDLTLDVIIYQSAYQGILMSVISIWLLNISIRRIGAYHASLMLALDPVLTAVFAEFWIGEELVTNHWFAVLLLSAGVAVGAGGTSSERERQLVGG